jgi:mannose-6-phosphate isomerase-like protein (cupin superfamily)
VKPFITTLTSLPSTIQTKTILSKHGFTCSLTSVAAGDKTPLRALDHAGEFLFYVVEGRATVHFDEVNIVIDQDHALLIAPDKAHCISADATSHAKLLRVEVPRRPVSPPEIVTLSS